MRVIFFLMFTFSVTWLSSQSTIRLDECIQWSREHNPATAQRELLNNDLQLKQKILDRNYFPQTNLNGKTTWQSSVANIPINFPGVEIPTVPKNQYSFTLDIGQNIYDGGITEVQKNLNGVTNAIDNQQLSVDLHALDKQVATLYFGVLLADKLIANARIIKENLDIQSGKVKAAIENGTAIEADLQNIEVRMLEVDQQEALYRQQRTAAINGLALLTGKDFSPDQPLDIPELTTQDGATIQRPELQLFALQQSAFSASESLAQAKVRPKLSAFAQLGYGKPGLNFLSDEFSTYAIVGAQVQIPLTHIYGRNTDLEIQRLSVQKDLVEKKKEQFLLQTGVQMSSLEEDIARLNGLIDSDKKIIALRQHIAQTASHQLDNGVITSNDYLEEINKEDQARQNLILHEIQMLQSIFNLNHTIGNTSN